MKFGFKNEIVCFKKERGEKKINSLIKIDNEAQKQSKLF